MILGVYSQFCDWCFFSRCCRIGLRSKLHKRSIDANFNEWWSSRSTRRFVRGWQYRWRWIGSVKVDSRKCSSVRGGWRVRYYQNGWGRGNYDIVSAHFNLWVKKSFNKMNFIFNLIRVIVVEKCMLLFKWRYTISGIQLFIDIISKVLLISVVVCWSIVIRCVFHVVASHLIGCIKTVIGIVGLNRVGIIIYIYIYICISLRVWEKWLWMVLHWFH